MTEPKLPPSPVSAQVPPPKKRGRMNRNLRWVGRAVAVVLAFVLLLGGGIVLFAYSPSGGPSLARLTAGIVNGLETGITIEIGTIHLQWPLKLSVRDVRLLDATGEWLKAPLVEASLQPASLVPTHGKWRIQLATALVRQATWSRLPAFAADPEGSEAIPQKPHAISLLPDWLSVEAENIVLEEARIGAAALALTPAEPYIPAFSTVQLAVQGMVSALTARVEMHAEIRPVPAPEAPEAPEVPEAPETSEAGQQEKADSTLSNAVPSELIPPKAPQAQPQAPLPLTRLLLKADWNNNTLSLNSRIEDTALLAPHLPTPALSGVNTPPLPEGQTAGSNPRPPLVIQGDISVHIPVVPPVAAQPMRVTWALQGTSPALPRILFSGALGIDDTALTWENVALRSPLASASTKDSSPTTAEAATTTMATTTATATTISTATPPATQDNSPANSLHSTGSFHFQQGPTAELDLQIPDIAALVRFGLAFSSTSPASPTSQISQGSVSAKVRITAPATVSIDMHSPTLVLPQGALQDLSLKVQGHSPPAAQSASPAALSPAGPSVWTLPTALKGKLEFTVRSCMGYGPVNLSTTWELEDILSTMGFRIANLQATMLGLRVQGGLAYANNTFKDAALDLLVTDTSAIAKLFNVPLKGCPLTFKAKVVPEIKEKTLQGQLNFGAGSYENFAWQSGEGTVRVDKTKAKLHLNIKGKLSARLHCSYTFADQVLRVDTVELSESTLNMGAKLLAATDIRFADGISIGETNISLRPSGTVHIKGKLESQALTLEASVANIPLAMAKAFIAAPIPQGTLSANVALKGSPSAPTGTVQLRVDNMPLASTVGGPQASLVVDGKLNRANTKGGASHHVQLQCHWEGLESLNNFSATAQIPLNFAPTPSLLMDSPLRAKLSWQGDIAPLWRLVPLPGRRLSGKAEVQVQVQGSLRVPVLTGQFFVGQGRFVDSVDGLLLDAITLEARYDARSQSLVRLTATDGRGGTLQLDGNLSAHSITAPQGIGGGMLNLHGIITALRPLRRDDLAVQLSGTVDISGPLTAPLLAANVCVDQALLQLLDGFGGGAMKHLAVEERTANAGASVTTTNAGASVTTTNAGASVTTTNAGASGTTVTRAKNMPATSKIATTSPKNTLAKKTKKDMPSGATPQQPSPLDAVTPALVPRCDISITAPNRLYIRGKGLDSEWKAKLRLSGPLADPHIVGNVTPIRGNLELLGHQFTLASGDIAFTGALPVNPALDVSLQYKSADIIALIVFSGSAKNPKMRLSSQPVLPDDEIIAHILFGKNMNSLSRFEALQAANTAHQLVDLGPSSLDIMASTRDLLGLEVLRLGSAEASRQTHAPRDASMQGTSSANPDDQAPTIEAGKYILDTVYVGLEQGTDAKTGTIVRVEVELLPNLSVEGRTSNESTGLGINWKRDY